YDLSNDAEAFGNGQLEDYHKALEEIPVAELDTSIDYDRTEWKHWTGYPCNTRHEVLIEQGEGVETGERCKMEAGTWYDPFTAETTDDSSTLDIDHIVPLGYTAAAGGNDWSEAEKEEYANDHLNLRAVSASDNRKKGSDGPGDWNVPNNEDFKCEYAVIWIDVMTEYGLSIEQQDKE